MRLSRQKALLLLAVTLLACRATEPNSTMPSREFILNDVNGRALPTYLMPTLGPTTIIVSGLLILEQSGRASMTEHRVDGNGLATDNTGHYTYTIIGGKVQFVALDSCPGTVMCAGPSTGTISANGLTLTVDRVGSGAILFDYNLVPNLALRD